MERSCGILKSEFDLHRTFESYSDAAREVDCAIYRYNNLRLHASCGYQTPEYTYMKTKKEKETLTVNLYQEKNILL
ncbi:transposase InsO family protein [Pedobacter sp. AK013]|uniref:integrase core domain-containing protein n=1 Tax=Pedobacter sp. AK013 TaxID=2723071 RepID=UPI0016228B06|nr:transposase InsO family protein [Pedobacter sp. AK013]